MTVNFSIQQDPPVYASPRSIETSADGTFQIALPPGTYAVSFVPDRRSGLFYGFYGADDPFDPPITELNPPYGFPGRPLRVSSDMALEVTLIPGYLIIGHITDAVTGRPITQWGTSAFHSIQTVRLPDRKGGFSNWSWSTSLAGFGPGEYCVWVPSGTYVLGAVTFSVYQGATKTVTVTNADLTGIDFALAPRPSTAGPATATPTRAP